MENNANPMKCRQIYAYELTVPHTTIIFLKSLELILFVFSTEVTE